jgi:hypothetical protein
MAAKKIHPFGYIDGILMKISIPVGGIDEKGTGKRDKK